MQTPGTQGTLEVYRASIRSQPMSRRTDTTGRTRSALPVERVEAKTKANLRPRTWEGQNTAGQQVPNEAVTQKRNTDRAMTRRQA